MSRHILEEAEIHPAIQDTISQLHRDLIDEVKAAIAKHDAVVVCLGWNPAGPKAAKMLKEQNVAHTYLEYGNYLSGWRRRNALKMWTGWPTFPMIWIKGTFVGGASDLKALIDKQELQPLLKDK